MKKNEKVDSAKQIDETEQNELIESKDINEEQLEKIKDEINNSKKTDKQIKKHKKGKTIIINIIMLILFVIYFVLIKLATKNIQNTETLIFDFKLFIIAELVITVIFFEIAYKKDSMFIGLTGIETFFAGAGTILLLDLYKKQSGNFDKYLIGIIGICVLYYIIKALILAFKKSK